MPKIRAFKTPDKRHSFFCPGCKCGHWFQTEGKPCWTWNGDVEKPTINPSILVRTPDPDNAGAYLEICHSFIRDGMIQFLGDCTHELAGKTVPLEDF